MSIHTILKKLIDRHKMLNHLPLAHVLLLFVVIKEVIMYFKTTAIAFHRNIWLIFAIFCSAALVALVVLLYNGAFSYGSILAQERFVKNPQIIFVIVPATFLITAYLCKRFSPNAAGSGTAHVVSALEKLSDSKKQSDGAAEYISPKTIIVTMICSVLCAAGGGALGREGPAVQISAGIFAAIAQRVRRFLPKLDLRSWIIAGSAAGFTIVFNAPFAGVIFAIEELSRACIGEKLFMIKTKVLLAVMVSAIVSWSIVGSRAVLGFPSMHFAWDFKVYLLLTLLALVSGFIAAIMKIITTKLTAWRKSTTGNLWYLFPILFGLLVAGVSFVVGQHSFGSGIADMNEAIKSPRAVIDIGDLAGRFINVVASIAAGCPGGILLPSIAIGAHVGSVFSLLLPEVDARIFISAGMSAFLSAILRAPFTVTVLVLEITNQIELAMPLLLSGLLASWTFQKCN